MTLPDLFELLAGAAVVGIILYDVVQTVVVPRRTSRAFRLGPFLIDLFWDAWRGAGRRMRSAGRREDFLGAFAPLSILMLLLAWTLSLVFGYGVILHALRDQVRPEMRNLGECVYLAGVAFFTLGFGDYIPVGGLARTVVLAASASGLAVVALVLSLLFNLYSAFQQREVSVLCLEARSGTPPSGVTLLETYASFEMLPALPALFGAWEIWSAEVLESHRAYPILPFFRSSHEGQSWVSALGAVLDAATLLLTTVESDQQGPAEMLHRIGTHTLSDLNVWCGLRCGPEVGVEREEWEAARQRLASVGFRLRETEAAWVLFARARSDYGGALNTLARHFMTPPATWIGDRSARSRLPEGESARQAEAPVVAARCTHLDQVRKVTPRSRGCEECLRSGDRWVHLRLCLICGHVGCCDSSRNKHATRHFQETGHPLIRSLERGEGWAWCYVDELTFDAP